MNKICPECQKPFDQLLLYCKDCGVQLVNPSEAQTLKRSYQTQPLAKLSLEVTVQPKLGEMQTYRDGEWAGTKGLSRALEGFSVRLVPTNQTLRLRYKGVFQGDVEVDWADEGEFLGSAPAEHETPRELEVFCIELIGQAASDYDVFYAAHLEGWDDSRSFKNGKPCGERKHRIEAIKVWILPRS